MMRVMLQEHSTLHEIVGGKKQSIRSGFFSWKSVTKNGIKVLKSAEKVVRVREEKMTQCENEVSVRTLWIHMSPELIW